jgi:hypothetical protein
MNGQVETLTVVRILREPDGQGWLVVTARGHAWLHGDRRSALEDKRWLGCKHARAAMSPIVDIEPKCRCDGECAHLGRGRGVKTETGLVIGQQQIIGPAPLCAVRRAALRPSFTRLAGGRRHFCAEGRG